MAYGSPAMLSAGGTTKTAVGVSRVKPLLRPRAVAQTASRTPDRTRTSQYTVLRSSSRGVGVGREVAVVVGGQRPGAASDRPDAALGARRVQPPGEAVGPDA